MRRRTIGQQRALTELRALARTALMVCDALAARGEESDDRPRRYLDALVRWTLGEEKPAHLAAATRAMETWRGEVFDALPKPVSPYESDKWGDALHRLSDMRADTQRNPGHLPRQKELSERCLIRVIMQRMSEPRAAADAQVVATLAVERKRATAEAVDALANARRAQAKADKVTAEEALGTLPGMEGR